MRFFPVFICLLVTNIVLAGEPVISVQILSKFHPQTLTVETHSRIFDLNPQTLPQWEFNAPAQEDISITVKGETRTYRGGIVASWTGSEYQVTNRIPLEMYVAGVVSGELGSHVAEQMINAQAILARTYALKMLQREPLSDLAYHQVFKGFDYYAQQLYPVSQQTRGTVLKSNSRLADVLFHAECGSAIYHAAEFWDSEDRAPAIKLPDILPAGQPWQVSLTQDQVNKVFAGSNQLLRLEQEQPVKIDTGQGHYNMEAFRLAINRQYGWNTIPSNEFSIEPVAQGWVLKGRGRGHLVGLCQQQASELAGQGWDYREILQLFYPQFTLEKRAD